MRCFSYFYGISPSGGSAPSYVVPTKIKVKYGVVGFCEINEMISLMAILHTSLTRSYKSISYLYCTTSQHFVFVWIRGCFWNAGPRSAVGSASASRARGPGLDTRSGNILSFLLPLVQEGQLSVTGESMCTKYWLIT